MRDNVGSQGGTQWLGVATSMGFVMAMAERLAALADVLGLMALSAVFLRVLFFVWYRRREACAARPPPAT